MQRWYIAILDIHAPGRVTSTCREDRSWHLLGGDPIYLVFSAEYIALNDDHLAALSEWKAS